jgi:isoleucyl-tRNA synthetase
MAKDNGAKDNGPKGKGGKAGDQTGTAPAEGARDWSETLFLPKTDFPMRAGLPEMEPKILARWAEIDLYGQLRATSKGRPKFVLHDGPPYANGNIHIGTALNKILKDLVVRSQQMLGKDSNYVPGWDCHGLPIEWKIEEQYRAKGKNKDEVPVNEFRKECRDFATHWLGVQRSEFKRLGVVGDWEKPYTTMSFPAEAAIANELMKFAMNGALYRGSKPVMWSVVEKTALAEAEVEYHDYQSDTIWAKFPVVEGPSALKGAAIVIWTTTPWTMPGNRAISYSSKVAYGLYEVTRAPDGNWAKVGDKLVLADSLAGDVLKSAKVEGFEKRAVVSAADLAAVTCAHPLRGQGYDFAVPLLDGEHVTDDAGTGFVHTAPGHGREDFEIWMDNVRALAARGIETAIPFTVDADGKFTKDAPGFEGRQVITDKGDKGDANEAVIKALAAAGGLIARGRLKHQYPHSWRSKKPVIFRNTPQWFIAMDRPVETSGGKRTIRDLALKAIGETEFVPETGRNRIRGMIDAKPDWVISRQRAWGVPMTIFRNPETDEIIPSASFAKSAEYIARVVAAFEEKGADAWFEAGAKERFLGGLVADRGAWEQVKDTIEVWFDSGSTHAFVLEDAVNFPGLAGIHRQVDGGPDRVMYLEGSDQHRGWFQSSLIESCGTRGRAPYDVVLTHGFVLDEKGQKMSKSLGNTVAPQDVIKSSGADILRLWVGASDYSDDLRIGPEILKTFVETYRKLRNTLRWMLGALAHHSEADRVAVAAMPELERLMLHRLAELDTEIRAAYAAYDYRKVVAALTQFMNADLSAFYFDVRKDSLYCDPLSSPTRKAALTVIDDLFRHTCIWLAPILSFTADEAWVARYPGTTGSVHVEVFPAILDSWRDDALAAKWETIRRVRRVVTGALELERAAKRIGSSLEAAPEIHVADPAIREALAGIDLAEVSITSAATLVAGAPPTGAFTLDDVPGVGVVPRRAEGKKCARSWRISPDVGSDAGYPDLTPRDAKAVRELIAAGRIAG